MFGLPKLLVYAVAALAIMAALGGVYHTIRKSGEDALKARQAEEISRRIDDANRADETARRCAADPSCGSMSDGFRRD
jgi:F0F1-type ATP synthase membrane subunit b/b'